MFYIIPLINVFILIKLNEKQTIYIKIHSYTQNPCFCICSILTCKYSYSYFTLFAKVQSVSLSVCLSQMSPLRRSVEVVKVNPLYRDLPLPPSCLHIRSPLHEISKSNYTPIERPISWINMHWESIKTPCDQKPAVGPRRNVWLLPSSRSI